MELSRPRWGLWEFMQSVTSRRVGLVVIAFAFVVCFTLMDWSRTDYAGEDKYNGYIVFFCAFFLFAGAALLFYEFDKYLSGKTEVHISETRASTPRTRHRTDRRIAGMPAFGLIATTFYSFVVEFALFLQLLIQPPASQGLYVRTISGFTQAIRYPGADPLIVTIDAQDNYFVNDRKVAPDKLQSVLADALRLRFTKAVFVQADREVDFGVVVLAVDAIKGAGAQAVLVSEPPKKTK